VIVAAEPAARRGVALLTLLGAVFLAVTIWPAYVLGVVRVSEARAARIERAVAARDEAVALEGAERRGWPTGSCVASDNHHVTDT
jgi:hypothetical protein